MSSERLTDEQREALASGLAVVLARVRCALVHGQTNGGRCVNCISWAKNVGVPEHLSRVMGDCERIVAEHRAAERETVLAERVPIPRITTGPKHMTVDQATETYLRDAAARVRSQRYWGSGVTALVASVLDHAADALRAEAGSHERSETDG